jgi:DNA-binding NarL/FixJ family response regulator
MDDLGGCCIVIAISIDLKATTATSQPAFGGSHMSAHKAKVFIVDDHPIFRRGLREVISGDPSFEVFGEAGDGKAALEAIRVARPDIAILDINLPSMTGLELCAALQRLKPPIRVMMLTLHDEEGTFNAAMDAGAQGYLVKENAVQELMTALRALAGGGIYFSPSVSRYMLSRRQRASALREKKTGFHSLTPTERLVLRLVADNKTNRDIAEELCMSPRTVETHRAHICEKLALRGSHGLLHFAVTHRSEL